MKLKILLIAVAALVALFVLNRYLNEKPQYIPGVPSSAVPGSGQVRQEFTVGFLPVT